MRSHYLIPRIIAVFTLALALAALPALAKDAAKAAGPIDLNTASQNQLESLPGIGPAMAKKIIAGRPYQRVADLARAGVPAKTIDKITPLVTVGGAAAAAPAPAPATAPAPTPKAAPAPAPAPAPKPAPSGKGSTGLAAARAQADATAQVPPAPGMVWVNPDSKAYHKQGDKWYGRTKRGQFMTEADAQKAGYHPAGERKPKAP